MAERGAMFCAVPGSLRRLTLVRALAIGILAAVCAVHAALDLPLTPHFAWLVLLLWSGFAVWAFLVQSEWRRRQSRQDETQACQRYLVRLAALSAGATHEMATPLSTLCITLGELRGAQRPPPDWSEQVELLWEQAQFCRGALAEISQAVAAQQPGKALAVSARQFVLDLERCFRTLRPKASLASSCELPEEGLRIEADHALSHALLTFLNNAADASPGCVELRAARSGGALQVRILDRGPGIPAARRGRLGKDPATRKEARAGRGVGLLIAQAALERYGSGMRIFERPGGGTCVQVELPMSRTNAEDKREYPKLRLVSRGKARTAAGR